MKKIMIIFNIYLIISHKEPEPAPAPSSQKIPAPTGSGSGSSALIIIIIEMNSVVDPYHLAGSVSK